MALSRIHVDFLVIGSGIAGLSFALKAAAHGSVAIVTKKNSAESNTNYAQGGVAAVLDPLDSFDKHIEDTWEAGAKLGDHAVIEMVVQEGPRLIHELIAMGTAFTKKQGKLSLVREGGHSAHRIVHADDATGREIERALLAQIRAHPDITMYEYHFALELLTEHHLGQMVTRWRPDIHCFGAYVLDEQAQSVKTFLAKSTILACGGAGQVYQHTTNPGIATGDGIAMAYRAKARIANMEFIQFHPTSLYHNDADSFLISEAVRGAGGVLRNQHGEPFMQDYDPRKELAPRDIVARAIDDQLKRHGQQFVWLDISHLPNEEIKAHFPNITATCLHYGIDITKEPIPVVPAAHYLCGGVVTDTHGRTSIHGLFACGETAYTGLHGANRLASNSLLEALVFSDRAVAPAAAYAAHQTWQTQLPDWDDSGTQDPQEWILIAHNRQELQAVMSNYVGIVRSSLRLERAFRRTHLLYQETESFYRRTTITSQLCELRNLIAVAYLIIRSAQCRRESRGLHYTLDFPQISTQECRPTWL